MSQSSALWSVDELVAATGGTLDGDGQAMPVTGISIDTRTIENGDLFVALQDQRDGHDFVTAAFTKGAAIALVNLDYQKQGDDGLLLRVNDPLAGLEKMAVAARARLHDKARVIAVTGSAGKTTTKEMMRLGFAHMGAVHASEKSYNNHWGVPLTLARMPRETDFAIVEIGMNHAGEIRPLTKMARPHIAVVTSVLPVHLEHFSGIEDIAEAKAEIFEGLVEQGYAVIPRDTPQFELLASRAKVMAGERISAFGEHDAAEHKVENIELGLTGSHAELVVRERQDGIGFNVGLPGRHNVLNATACITAWFCAVDGLDIPRTGQETYGGLDGVLKALATMHMEPAGRGQVFELESSKTGHITLIDESYNANPASMRAAFENLSLYPPGRRKVAVIGDMLELGNSADELHVDLVDPIKKAGINVVFACGAHMKKLFETLPENLRGGYEVDASMLKSSLLQGVQDGDIIMIKGSFGSHMGSLVEALKDGRLVESN
jgi:UDP-N-acetylmuramoyl-tripeptide--D-alanyl-D-alanine ligase